ncbi:MAG: hypothetical protein EZS28_046232 [Streblomastix strix]|uniref:Uncharacterized protein n=1 Tax=Streblomastix strix TaxID=222440 RepID=A0A5J4TK22_9EUKA|nr:MAG: hypothetical protein EZS28_046232 [Streblomastix strix]
MKSMVRKDQEQNKKLNKKPITRKTNNAGRKQNTHDNANPKKKSKNEKDATDMNEQKTDSITIDIEKEQDEIDAIAVDKEEEDDETEAIATDKQKEEDETDAANNNNHDLEDAEMEMEKEEDETDASNNNKHEFEDAEPTAMNKDIVRDGKAVKRKRGRPRKCQGGERIDKEMLEEQTRIEQEKLGEQTRIELERIRINEENENKRNCMLLPFGTSFLPLLI